MKKILVPISFSTASANALSQAFSIASQFGATVTMLHCYAAQEYNRRFDFGKMDYDKGIRKMLADFYNEQLEHSSQHKFNFLTHAGPISEVISNISGRYDLLVLSKKTAARSKSSRWFTDKLSYITTKAICPVLLLPVEKEDFSFSEVKNIWHIKRQEVEAELINNKLAKLKIVPEQLSAKSLEQDKFVSSFWQKIVAYLKHGKQALPEDISEAFSEEKIDLVILVNHRKGRFEEFVKGDAFQAITQFDIPILICQANV